MMKTVFVAAAALAMTAAALNPAPAQAQDANQAPAFGVITLSAGFDNGASPEQRRVRAGGPNDGSRLPGACTGNIGTPPDFRIDYTAGNRQLIFRSVSGADTTLIIKGPDGRWHCDDDSFGDLDAEYRFNTPQSGAYYVWLGVVRMREADTTFVVAEH
jgi:hypothetical protein